MNSRMSANQESSPEHQVYVLQKVQEIDFVAAFQAVCLKYSAAQKCLLEIEGLLTDTMKEINVLSNRIRKIELLCKKAIINGSVQVNARDILDVLTH